jgi:hypothetical protein
MLQLYSLVAMAWPHILYDCRAYNSAVLANFYTTTTNGVITIMSTSPANI